MARSVLETIEGGTLVAVLVARVLRTIEEHALLARGARVLLGVSGGADSMAMLHALRSNAETLAIELEVATVDHGLRAGSDAEHARVAFHVRASGLPCEVLRVTIAPGASIQEQARDARYEVLREHARARGCPVIAVAHTLDDQAETVLARLLRGSGVRGLAGALRRREDGIVRPLLDVSRGEVLAYLHELGIAPIVEDPANSDRRYLRSRVRHALLPALTQEQPEIAGMLAQLADDAREHRELVEALAEAAGPDDEAPAISALATLAPPVRRERLRRWAVAHGLPPLRRVHLEALERLCLTARGEARLPGALVVAIESGRLALRAIEPP